jgi:hypothetical protein
MAERAWREELREELRELAKMLVLATQLWLAPGSRLLAEVGSPEDYTVISTALKRLLEQISPPGELLRTIWNLPSRSQVFRPPPMLCADVVGSCLMNSMALRNPALPVATRRPAFSANAAIGGDSRRVLCDESLADAGRPPVLALRRS